MHDFLGCQTVRTRHKWSKQGMRDPAYSLIKCGVCLAAAVTDCQSVKRHYRLSWCLWRIELLVKIPNTREPHTCACALEEPSDWVSHSCRQSVENAQTVSNFTSAPFPRHVKYPKWQTFVSCTIHSNQASDREQLRTGNQQGRAAQKNRTITYCTERIVRQEQACSVEEAQERTALQTV